MLQAKSLPKPVAFLLNWYGKLSIVLVVCALLFMLIYPIFEAIQEQSKIKDCMAKHHVEKCVITTVAVPA